MKKVSSKGLVIIQAICFFIWTGIAIFRFVDHLSMAWLCAACAVLMLISTCFAIRNYLHEKNEEQQDSADGGEEKKDE